MRPEVKANAGNYVDYCRRAFPESSPMREPLTALAMARWFNLATRLQTRRYMQDVDQDELRTLEQGFRDMVGPVTKASLAEGTDTTGRSGPQG